MFNGCNTVYLRNMDSFRYIIVSALHKSDKYYYYYYYYYYY